LGGLLVRARPVIGIAARTQEALAGECAPSWTVGQQYVRALTSAGALPWVIPLFPDDEETLKQIYGRLDAVFLMGGVDVDPANYNEEREPSCGKSDPARDWVEVRLVQWAVRDSKPLFGICRGVQLINVALGGTLFQDLPQQCPSAITHDFVAEPSTPKQRDAMVHEIQILPSTRLQQTLGDKPLDVNSMHHQGIKDLAPHLVASALAPDGLIEGVEGRDGSFLVGVQWHPEEMTSGRPEMCRLFTEFVGAAAAYQELASKRRENEESEPGFKGNAGSNTGAT
jgi:putative glutamine amidotransferase